MKKEEILKMSKEENKEKDYYELELDTRATKIGAILMLLLTLIFYALEIMLTGDTNYGLYSLIAIFNAGIYSYKSIKTKSKLQIFTAVLWILVTCICTYGYITNLIQTSTIL